MIDLIDLSKSFDSRVVLDGFSLSVAAGERVAIFGESGTGKTTLLRLIAGLEVPDRGEIRLGGRLASSSQWQMEPSQRNLGFTFQKPSLWPHLTVAQNISFGLQTWPAEQRRIRVSELIQRVGLGGMDQRYPGGLSGGEARCVELARTLAPSPSILLLDEPFSHLDTHLQQRLETLVSEHVSRENSTMIFVSHDSDSAARMCNRIVPMVNP